MTSAVNSSTLLLKRVSYIHHPVRFKKDQVEVQTLIDSNNEVNIINPAYTVKLSLKVCSSNVEA